MVSAVTGFVDGFFKGRDWRDAKEDRKLDRERQQRMDKLYEEKHGASMEQHQQMTGIRSNQEARAADLHGYRTNELDFLEAERELQRERDAAAREFWQRLGGEMGATPGDGAQPAPSGGGQDNAYPVGTPVGEQPAPTQRYAEAPQPRLGYGALPDAQQPPAPAPATIANESDADFAARVAAQRERTNQLLRDTAPGSTIAGGGGGDVAGSEGNDRLATQSGSPAIVEDIHRLRGKEGPSIDRDISMQLGRVAAGLLKEGSGLSRFIGGAVDYVTKSHDARDASMDQRRMAGAASEWYQTPEAVEYFKANPSEFEKVQQDPLGVYARANGQLSPASAPGQGNPSDRVPSEKAQDAETVSAKPEQQQAADMSVKAAVDAAHDPKVNLSLGLKPGQNVTKKQMDKGAQAYIDRYYETVVPQAVQFYVSRGEPEKAQALMELVESRQGKAALKDIGRSTFSVLNGDYDGAAEHMLSAFKQYGYADSDMEVDLEATGIVHDDSGQPIGGKVVFRDKKSGETFEKSFATADEFIKYGHMMISPTTVADLLFEKKPDEKGAITQQDVLKAATEIMKADPTGSTTMDQAIEQAAASLGRLGVSVGGSGGGQEPPLYRLNK